MKARLKIIRLLHEYSDAGDAAISESLAGSCLAAGLMVLAIAAFVLLLYVSGT